MLPYPTVVIVMTLRWRQSHYHRPDCVTSKPYDVPKTGTRRPVTTVPLNVFEVAVDTAWKIIVDGTPEPLLDPGKRESRVGVGIETLNPATCQVLATILVIEVVIRGVLVIAGELHREVHTRKHRDHASVRGHDDAHLGLSRHPLLERTVQHEKDNDRRNDVRQQKRRNPGAHYDDAWLWSRCAEEPNGREREGDGQCAHHNDLKHR